MARIGQPFTCGIWTVRDGGEDEFVARWTALVSSAEAARGSESFLLIQDRADPHRFISFGAWRTGRQQTPGARVRRSRGRCVPAGSSATTSGRTTPHSGSRSAPNDRRRRAGQTSRRALCRRRRAVRACRIGDADSAPQRVLARRIRPGRTGSGHQQWRGARRTGSGGVSGAAGWPRPGARNRSPLTRSETPLAVQVRRDAAQVERPAGAEQQAQVDVADLADDTLVEHQADLLGDGVERATAYLAPRRRVRRPARRARRPRGRPWAWSRPRRRHRACPRRRAWRGSRRRRSGRGTPRASSRRRAARPPGRPAAAARTATSAGRAARAPCRRPRTGCPRRRPW